MVKMVYIRGLALASLLIIATVAALWFLDQQRTNLLNAELQKLSWQSDDSRLFLSYMDRLSEDDASLVCSALEHRTGQQMQKMEWFAKKIDEYRNANMLSGEYYSIKRSFIYNVLELWLNFDRMKNDCGKDVNYVFYFYTEDDPDRSACPDCGVQASILDKLRYECPNTWTFALPVNTDVDMVNVIKKQYGVEKAPAVVVNGEHVHNGLATYEELEREVSCGPNPFEAQ